MFPLTSKDGLRFDLTASGLPFYCGRAILRQEIYLPEPSQKVVFELGNLRAAVAHVRLNGLPCGSLAWQPFRLDVTGQVRQGKNSLELELVNTLRNLLGPHHLAGGEQDYTGPGEYRDRMRWTDDVILAPFGFGWARFI